MVAYLRGPQVHGARDGEVRMTAQRPHSVAEYLALERAGTSKHEYYHGEIFARAGSSEAHNSIVSNIIIALGSQLRTRPCRVYPSDLRLKIPKTGLYTYPDVSIVCGTPLFDDAERDTLLNPNIIIEVLSPSTERYDRGKKFHHYQTITTLQDYILVAQDEHRIEHYARHDDGHWLLRMYDDISTAIPLPAIQCTLALSEVYEKVDIEPSDIEPLHGGG